MSCKSLLFSLLAFLVLPFTLRAQEDLTMETLTAGQGDSPKMGQEVEFHLTATDAEGNEIWSTRTMGVAQFVTLGKDNDLAAQAMSKAMTTMQKGGRYKVNLPKKLMGENSPPNMKGDHLIMDMEILNFGQPAPSGMEVVRESLEAAGVDAAMEKFRSLCKNPGEYVLRQMAVNMFGYELMQRKKLDEALEVLQMNTKLYPDSANAYDSLGDAYLSKGDKEMAKANFEMALKKDPNFTASKAKLDKLK